MREANISFPIRQENDDLSYLGMDALASLVCESDKQNPDMQGLKRDATDFKPVRNAVGDTGLVTADAKDRLRLVFQNIRGKLKELVNE